MQIKRFDAPARWALLEENAQGYLEVATDNLTREYPYRSVLAMAAPGPIRSHRQRHPAFYGSFDWHSCVEMAWVAVRLLRLFPALPGEARTRAVLHELLSPENLEIERRTFSETQHRSLERPYGWGWYLTLHAELLEWDDPQGAAWSAPVAGLAGDFADRLTGWLPRLSHPQRGGMHVNTAFALSRSWDWANRQAGHGHPELRGAILEAAERLFAADSGYPAHYEPSGADFLSGALTEAELMSRIWSRGRFAAWLDGFLPDLDRCLPANLFAPVEVTDPSDGQLAHLAGLNLSRAAAFVVLAERLGGRDGRHGPLLAAAAHHASSSLDATRGTDYMLEHWLVAYAVLTLS
jgi:hypothetical protein